MKGMGDDSLELELAQMTFVSLESSKSWFVFQVYAKSSSEPQQRHLAEKMDNPSILIIDKEFKIFKAKRSNATRLQRSIVHADMLI